MLVAKFARKSALSFIPHCEKEVHDGTARGNAALTRLIVGDAPLSRFLRSSDFVLFVYNACSCFGSNPGSAEACWRRLAAIAADVVYFVPILSDPPAALARLPIA